MRYHMYNLCMCIHIPSYTTCNFWYQGYKLLRLTDRLNFNLICFNRYFYIAFTDFFLSFLLCAQVKVNVLDKNDSPPVFQNTPLVYTVSEDLGAGHPVATIKATDPDSIDTLTYSLISGDDRKFLLQTDTGTLMLRDTVDRETKDVYTLVVRVSDGVQFTETEVTIQVSNVFSFEFSIKECFLTILRTCLA